MLINPAVSDNRADITIFEGLATDDHPMPLHIDISIVRAGHEAQAERAKTLKHRENCTQANSRFLPFILGQWGRSGPGFKTFIQIVKQAAAKKGYTRDDWGSLKVPEVRAVNDMLKQIDKTLAISNSGMITDKARRGTYPPNQVSPLPYQRRGGAENEATTTATATMDDNDELNPTPAPVELASDDTEEVPEQINTYTQVPHICPAAPQATRRRESERIKARRRLQTGSDTRCGPVSRSQSRKSALT